jgi:hypothetical protein
MARVPLAKMHNTQRARAILADARDLLGGDGMVLGYYVASICATLSDRNLRGLRHGAGADFCCTSPVVHSTSLRRARHRSSTGAVPAVQRAASFVRAVPGPGRLGSGPAAAARARTPSERNPPWKQPTAGRTARRQSRQPDRRACSSHCAQGLRRDVVKVELSVVGNVYRAFRHNYSHFVNRRNLFGRNTIRTDER